MQFKMQRTSKDESGEESLSSKLNNMSLADRSQGLHDLHGVADLEEETPQMLESKMQEMNICLSNVASLRLEEDSSAYYWAVEMSPDYVEHLKLQCLRTDLYKAREAAMRVIRFFDHKRRLFGEQKVVQEICFRDLDAETADLVERGFVQLLPQRDRAGRAIMFVYGKISSNYSVDAVVSTIIQDTMMMPLSLKGFRVVKFRLLFLILTVAGFRFFAFFYCFSCGRCFT
jgi:hypothetical protein